MSENFSFGYWVRRRRRALDLTQADLARRASCSVSLLRKIEADERRPSLQLVQLLAEIFALDTDEREALLRVVRGDRSPDQLELGTRPAIAPGAAPLPQGTVTFLFSDIAGSTLLWQSHPVRMRMALPRHDVILREAVAAHGGYVFKMVGDGVCAVFATAPDAVAAALSAQGALRTETWERPPGDPPAFRLAVRLALHSGVAELRDGDYFGLTISRVARLVVAAHGGQVLLSAATAELVRDQLQPGVTLRDLGDHWLPGLARPKPIYQLCAPDLPQGFPPLLARRARASNLPTPATAFIGRARDLAGLAELLARPEVRLVTLIGPGGSGKTRLALQAAAALCYSGAAPHPARPAQNASPTASGS
jgi:class 3 adenylate cyclase